MNSQLPSKKSVYMYASATEGIEAKRLDELNKLHNPHTLKFIQRHLSDKKSLLELGCGSGQLASEIIKLADTSTQFLGIDSDPAQVKRSQKLLLQFEHRVKIIQLNIMTELDQLAKLGPFDLIYCRWVLVHLPKDKLVNVLKKIMNLLTNNGIFICEECDNRTVEFKPAANRIPKASYQKATKIWLKLSQFLMANLKNDLELTSDKLKNLLFSAGNGKGEIRIESQYQVILQGMKQKKLIPDGYRSSKDFFTSINKPIEQFIGIFDACVADDAIEVPFLTQKVVSYQNRKLNGKIN